MRIFCLSDVVLEWQDSAAVLRRKTVQERKRGALVVSLVGSALCSVALFAGWPCFALFEIVMIGIVAGSLFLNAGKVLIRFADRSFYYSGQQSAPVASLWQRGRNEGDSYWVEFGFTDVTGNKSTVAYADEVITSWKCWSELTAELELPLEDHSFIAPQR